MIGIFLSPIGNSSLVDNINKSKYFIIWFYEQLYSYSKLIMKFKNYLTAGCWNWSLHHKGVRNNSIEFQRIKPRIMRIVKIGKWSVENLSSVHAMLPLNCRQKTEFVVMSLRWIAISQMVICGSFHLIIWYGNCFGFLLW